METNKIPTAEELMYQNDILNPSRKITQTMIEFAKLHVKQALEAAGENAKVELYCIYGGEDATIVKKTMVRYNSFGVNEVCPEDCIKYSVSVNEESILNSYNYDNIK